MVFRTARGGVPVTVSRPAGSVPFRKAGGFLAGEAGWFPEDVGRGGHGRFMGIMNKSSVRAIIRMALCGRNRCCRSCLAGQTPGRIFLRSGCGGMNAVRHDSVGHAARLFSSITGMPHSCRNPSRPSFASCSGRGRHERVRHGLFPGCSRIYLFPAPACRGYFLQKNVWGLRIVLRPDILRFGV